MSLFICNKCGCVENTSLMTKGLYTDPTAINLTGMEMDGWDDENGTWGEPNYLCSECNTNKWHGEFDKVYPTVEEKIIASYSSKGFITKYDHPEGLLKHEDGEWVLNYNHPTVSMAGYMPPVTGVVRGETASCMILDDSGYEYMEPDTDIKHTLGGLLTLLDIDINDHIPKDEPKQPEHERERNLARARLKREIKSLKKQLPINKELLKQLQKKYKDL